MAFYDPNREGVKSRVFLYALSTCVHCRAAKRLLNELGTPYDHVDVDLLPPDQMQECLNEMSQYNPAQSFPTMIIGSKIVVGDMEDDIRQAVARMGAAK